MNVNKKLKIIDIEDNINDIFLYNKYTGLIKKVYTKSNLLKEAKGEYKNLLLKKEELEDYLLEEEEEKYGIPHIIKSNKTNEEIIIYREEEELQLDIKKTRKYFYDYKKNIYNHLNFDIDFNFDKRSLDLRRKREEDDMINEIFMELNKENKVNKIK